MYFNKRLSYGEFGMMFFDVSAKLSKENKKMRYRDWMDMRDIAISRRCCGDKLSVPKVGEEITISQPDGLVVSIDDGEIEIHCSQCKRTLIIVDHKDTAEEIISYFNREDEKRVKMTEQIRKEITEEARIGNLKADVIKAGDLSPTKLDISGVKIDDKAIVYSGTINTIDNASINGYNNNIINNKNKKENENMMNTNKMFKGLDFGKANKDLFRLSHLGLAVKNAEGTFVSYDKNNKNLVDVDLFDFDLDGMIYKMPVAHNQVVVGDVIIHNGNPVLVKDALTNSDNLEVIDPVAGEIKTIMPTKNMFGFNFFTKILCLMDMNNLGASTDSPFGNMMPFMMMSAMKDGDGGNNDMMTMMMMSQMMGGNSSMGDMFSNPMMMMAMMSGDGKMGDMLPMMMMSGIFNQPQAQSKVADMPTHGCGGNCTCNSNVEI